LNEELDEIRAMRESGAAPEQWTVRLERARQPIEAKRADHEAQLERLTAREKEVLRLMAEGTSSRVIASQLGISYTTVRTHIRSLGSKLGVHSKLEAIVKARELALVE